MRTSRWLTLASMALMAVLTCRLATLEAEDRVDNPTYASWFRFPKGTTIGMRSVNATAGRTSEVVTTTMLFDVAADNVTLVSSSVVKDKTGDSKFKPDKRVEPKTISLPNGLPKGLTLAQYLADVPPGATAEGTESLKVDGREIKTKWYQYTVDVDGTKIQGKRWLSADVPGNIVKSEVTISGAAGFSSTLKLEMVEFKTP